MKPFLILVAFVCLTFWGCSGDNGVTSQNQNSIANPSQDQTTTQPPADQNQTVTEQQSPICYANNFVGQSFQVISYKNNVITADIALINCTLTNSRLKGEVRRPHTRGIREFVGDARHIHGNQITIFTGTLPKSCHPKKGETLKMIWKPRHKH
jgi:hypothetical protein